MSEPQLLPRVSVASLTGRRRRNFAAAEQEARQIVAAVRDRGEAAVREYAGRFDELEAGAPLLIDRPTLSASLGRITADERGRLERVAQRIRAFAQAQRAALGPVTLAVPGGSAGHWIAPHERAGCYAPGGRYPLPSTVLMTAVTARVAGVREVWVASPRPAPMTLAAAAVAGADGVLAVGGAHAIAALAYGAGPLPRCDVVVGPGNRYVAAAKQLVAGQVAIDMVAGPTELTVFADHTADPGTIAADLLAQAEHDPDAQPVLVTTEASLAERVEAELERQLGGLPTAAVARAALANGGVVLVRDVAEGIDACDALAPEHLALMLADGEAVAPRLAHYGALFIGAGSAEVLGDYGAGPNHVLPTGGTARSWGGLSVYTFLRVRTWLKVDDRRRARSLAEDAVWFARAEGLEAHARAAEARLD